MINLDDVEKTETLPQFTRPKPQANRRRGSGVRGSALVNLQSANGDTTR